MTNDPSTSRSYSDENSNKKRLRTGGMIVGGLALVGLAFGAGAYTFGPHLNQTFLQSADSNPLGASPIPVAAERGAPPRMMEQGAPFSFADLVEHVTPAVVTILVDREETAQNTDLPDNIPPQLRDFFKQFQQGQGRGQGQDQDQDQSPQTFKSEAMGSGFIIDPDGYIVTNNHVIEQAKKISVKLPDNREFQAKLVGTDPATDVALLHVDGVHNLPTVAFGDDRKLRVGDWVIAVGNPFGLGGTVTAGIVSSIGRDIGMGQYNDFIQIDAPINRGNSGGPTFDLTGRVVGMNSAIFSPSGGSVGIGFAIPASTVEATVQQLRANGSVTRGWLGVEIQNLTPDLAASIGVSAAKGALVARVVQGSPAEAAGFRQGDVITSLNGKDVDDSRDLTRQVANLHVGEKAQFSVLRDGQRRAMTATIVKRDDQKIASNDKPQPEAAPAAPPTTSALGLKLSSITPDIRDQLSLSEDVHGVVVASVDPNSDAADKGLRAGDVIMSIGNKAVTSPADVAKGVKDAQDAKRDSVLMLVANQQGQRFVAVKVGKG
jgi:serine protease Do